MKRALRATLTIAAIAGIAGWVSHTENQLGHARFGSGYVVFVSVTFLAAYHLRKKFSFLPLGNSASWLQAHIYVGWFAMAVFGMHVKWQLPSGWLESVLFWLFVATSGSGLYGLYLSKVVPRRLSRLREEAIYERIPGLRLEVQRAAHEVVQDLLKAGDAPALADFYTTALIPYFVQDRGPWYYLQPNSRLRNRLRMQLNQLVRYLEPSQQEAKQRLARLIDRRDDLDFHHAQQSRLRTWLFLHIAGSYALLLLAVIHAILALAFWGGAV
ncbi:MAG: hypothetical protein AAGF97_07225 [Planctomycetota bacterium]